MTGPRGGLYILLVALAVVVSCGEIGSDDGPDAKWLAQLQLFNEEASFSRAFDLGRYNNLDDCASIIQYEAESYPDNVFYVSEGGRGDYGGFKAGDDWMAFKVVETSCSDTQSK